MAWLPWLLLAGMIAVYAIIFTGLAFDLHAAQRTHKSDLGQMDQAIWNTSRGRFVEEIKQDFLSTRLTDHVEPIYAPLSLAYWVWNDVRAMLLLQALAVALGAVPLFALARRKVGAPLALGFAAAWLLNPSLQSAVLTELHAIPFAVPLILWAFWAVEARRPWQFLAAALLVASVKEEAALLAAGLGAWAVWRAWVQRTEESGRRAEDGGRRVNRRMAWVGMTVIVAALAWFVLATFVIVPAFGAEVHRTANSIYFQRYGVLGDSPLSILKNLLTNPGLVWSVASEPARVNYLLALFAGFGFLSLFGLDVLLLSLPVLLANLLSSFAAQYYGDFRYTAPLIPYFAVAAVYGLHRTFSFFRMTSLRRGLITALALVWLMGWAGWTYAQMGRGPGGGAYDPPVITEHHRLADRFFAQIPPDAPLTATAALHPHLAHRRFIYKFPYGLDPVPPAQPALWAIIDVTGDTDMAPGDLFNQVQAMLDGDWGVVDAVDGYLLLRRGEPNKTIPDAFYDFARTPDDPDALAQTYPLTFDDVQVTTWPRWRQATLITQWLVGQDYQPGTVRPWIEVRTPDGRLLYTYDDSAPPALVWYPPAKWRPGDRIRITTLPMYPPRTWGVAVGVVHGPDPFQPAHRLPASDAAPKTTIHTPDGTLALAGAWRWNASNRLDVIPADVLTSDDLGPYVEPQGREHPVQFRLQNGELRPLRAWLPDAPPAPGRPFDFWLRWDQGIPDGYQPFVHVRRGDDTLIQLDGPPHLFIPVAPHEEPVNDWREFILPEDIPPGETIRLVVGLYSLETGERLDILGPDGKLAGNEVVLAEYQVAPPPVPDQPCAFLSDICLSQP
jgi:uncharacterized membrane protein